MKLTDIASVQAKRAASLVDAKRRIIRHSERARRPAYSTNVGGLASYVSFSHFVSERFQAARNHYKRAEMKDWRPFELGS